MKKAIKWLVLGIFVVLSIGFAAQQADPGTDNHGPKPGSCRCAKP
jgi:hypothetical protein